MEIGEKFLPIGTVVILKGAKKRLMITGYAAIDMTRQDKVFDYSGCIFPIGILSTDKNLLFDHDQIEKVFAIGYQDEEQKEFVENLKKNLTEENIKKVLDDMKSNNNAKKTNPEGE